MKQLLLATVLIAVPMAGFTGFEVLQARASTAANAPAPSLGDLSAFATIISDVQGIATKGDLAAARTRIKDFEIAWDDASKGLRPMDPGHWDMIDQAADAAFTAIRAQTPDVAAVGDSLAALQATLVNQVVTK